MMMKKYGLWITSEGMVYARDRDFLASEWCMVTHPRKKQEIPPKTPYNIPKCDQDPFQLPYDTLPIEKRPAFLPQPAVFKHDVNAITAKITARGKPINPNGGARIDRDACEFLVIHHDVLKDDPERMSSDFMKSLIFKDKDRCPEVTE